MTDKYLIVLKERDFPYRCTDIHVHLQGIEDLCSLLLQQQEKFELISVMRFACREKKEPEKFPPAQLSEPLPVRTLFSDQA